MMRAAIYARYSSDNQREASIADQIRICREFAERQRWTVVETYSDSAMSGVSSRRPDLRRLQRDATQKHFDVLVAESLDRLSRDIEDTAGLHKRLSFVGVQIVTVSEGPIGHLHVGLKSTMSALFLKELAEKTRRGLRGRIEAGRSGGGNSYGYRVVRKLTDGAVTTGERAIDPEQAPIVVRIFQLFVAGHSSKAIAKTLNREGVPGPGGGPWGPSTIHGNPQRGTGVLNNNLYRGTLVWNRLRYVKDPDTGKRVSRLNPENERIVKAVPDLRIVDDALWDAVKTRQQATRKLLATGINRVRLRRPTHIFSGLTKCGVCGSGFTVSSRDRLACAGATDRDICTNRLTIARAEIEARVLKAMEERLWNEELFQEFCKEFTRERNRLHQEAGAAASAARREQATIDRRLSEIVEWIASGEWRRASSEVSNRMHAEMAALERQKAELAATVTAAERARQARPLLHPQMGQLYRQWVIDAKIGLRDAEKRPEATTALRAMVKEITLTPVGDALSIVLEGDLAAMLAAAKPKGVADDDISLSVTMVAGAGFEPATFGL